MRAPATQQRKTELRWAIIRLVFGFIQIVGATTSLLLLIGSGVSKLTVISVVITGLFTVLSRILFSRSKHEPGK